MLYCGLSAITELQKDRFSPFREEDIFVQLTSGVCSQRRQLGKLSGRERKSSERKASKLVAKNSLNKVSMEVTISTVEDALALLKIQVWVFAL